MIAGHRIDVSEMSDDDSVFPFNYAREGRQILPFFTTKERAERFESGFPTDVRVFEPCCLLAGFVATREMEEYELVLDAGFAEERTLTEDERLLLRKLSRPR